MDAVSPVIDGLQDQEIVIAKNQKEYRPLPALRVDDGYILCRFHVSDKDLDNIQKTRSVYIYMLVGDRPVTPIAVETTHPIPAEQELIDAKR